jgi:hypothetical protein
VDRWRIVVVMMDEEKREITVGKKFLLLVTAIKSDPWTTAEEKLFTPRVVITTTIGDEAGRLLYETPLG